MLTAASKQWTYEICWGYLQFVQQYPATTDVNPYDYISWGCFTDHAYPINPHDVQELQVENNTFTEEITVHVLQDIQL
jgi:hypothetical protein